MHKEPEDAHRFKGTSVDPIALGHISKITERFRRNEGLLDAQIDWYDKACPSVQYVAVSHF